MRKNSKNPIRELRKIIGRTQGEFAMMIGASKDAVVSWELRRNKLSESFARRIAFATGVEADGLLRGRFPLMSYVSLAGREPFTGERFELYRKTYWGRNDEATARQHARNCADALEMLFVAAVQPVRGNKGQRLPGVVDSFIQWCERTREDFHLTGAIEKQLEQRKGTVVISHTYEEWRRMQKEDPGACRFMGFKDDPRKDGRESLALGGEGIPIWRPGHPMRGAGVEPLIARKKAEGEG